jgi:hypothetical protein
MLETRFQVIILYCKHKSIRALVTQSSVHILAAASVLGGSYLG